MKPQTSKPCSIRQLAGYVGLSTCTVSKILNGGSGSLKATEATRKRVLEAAKKLSYVPNINATRLFRRKSNVIAILAPPPEEMGNSAFADPHFMNIMVGVERRIVSTRYNLMFMVNREDFKQSGRYRDLFRSGMIDGMLIWGVARKDSYWTNLKELSEPRIFLTTIPEEKPGSAPVNYIVSDYEQAGYEVLKLVLEKGARKILWLAGKRDTSINRMIREGQERALKERSMDMGALELEYSSQYNVEAGVEATKKALDRKSFDAIVATSPGLARGAQKEAERRGLGIKVASFDGHHDLICGELVEKRFLSALCDDVKIGELAVPAIIDLIEGRKEGPCHIKAPISLFKPEDEAKIIAK